MKKKTLLIGWDAADWKIIQPLMDKGLMPNLKKLVHGGVSGNLMTLDPPNSPMLWTSIATGKYPHKHGITGFVEPNSYGNNIREVHITSRKGKAVWNILMQQGYRVHQVNWWPSHPAEPLNGINISNFYQLAPDMPLSEPWPMPEGTVYPPEKEALFAALRIHPDELTPNHLQPFIPNVHKIDLQDSEIQELLMVLRKIIASCATAQSATVHILEQEDWDFLSLYYVAIDEFSHYFMKYHPPRQTHISQQLYDIFNNVIAAAYRYHDMLLGQLIELAGKQATVVLVSDHGFHSDHLRLRHIPKEEAGPSWEHSSFGIFVMRGPNIRKNTKIHGACLIDITPTLLAHLGEPIGLDMDGKILAPIFLKDPGAQTIDSWDTVRGNCGMHPADKLDDPVANQAALNRLIDLGYIAELNDNMQTNIQNVVNEQEFYKARSYINIGSYSKATPILTQLYKTVPSRAYYGYWLAHCYVQTDRITQAKAIVLALQKNTKAAADSVSLSLLQSSVALSEQEPDESLKYLEPALDSDPTYPGLYRQVGLVHLHMGKLERAEKYFDAAILNNDRDYQAYHRLGEVFLGKKQYERAAEAILSSIHLRFFNPQAHSSLGQTLLALGQYEAAEQAFLVALHLMPDVREAKKHLLEIYDNHIVQPEKAASLRAQLPDKSLPEVIIVSGLPRSGTSMMMQMLERGGIPVFTDGKRTADANNPKGYYEHEAVKSLAQDTGFLADAANQAVKVVAHLLFYLPAGYRYKVIFMERDIEEIMQSQQRMLLRLNKAQKSAYSFKVWRNFHETIDKVYGTLKVRSDMDFLFVRHADALSIPDQIAKDIQRFLGYAMQSDLMIKVVDKALYRERIEDNNY